MVLHGNNLATNSLGMFNDGVLVKWFDGEGIKDSHVDVLFLQFISCLYGLEQSHTRTDHKQLVFWTLANNLEKNNNNLLEIMTARIKAYFTTGLSAGTILVPGLYFCFVAASLGTLLSASLGTLPRLL